MLSHQGAWCPPIAMLILFACEPSLVITSPGDGAFLDASHDREPFAGIQIDVEVSADCVAAGTRIDLILEDDVIVGSDAVGEDGRVTFRSVTIPSGEHTLVAMTRVSDPRSSPVTLSVSAP